MLRSFISFWVSEKLLIQIYKKRLNNQDNVFEIKGTRNCGLTPYHWLMLCFFPLKMVLLLVFND